VTILKLYNCSKSEESQIRNRLKSTKKHLRYSIGECRPTTG
jgi:hypothetical protein